MTINNSTVTRQRTISTLIKALIFNKAAKHNTILFKCYTQIMKALGFKFRSSWFANKVEYKHRNELTTHLTLINIDSSTL